MASRDRPLSPFLNYRFEYTMVLSFAHRITGVLLSAGAFVLVLWLAALACGPDVYARVGSILNTWIFRLLLLGWLFSFFYHLANGIRHLAWDLGFGFEKRRARQTAWIVAIAAAAMTAAYVWAAIARNGSLS
jgi:succinate dehydrogenase / fumarate reductase cytochrome b subunit